METPFEALRYLFPPPQRIAMLGPSQIASLGIISSRANALIALARAVADGDIRLEPGVDVETTMKALRALPGIGEWTAQYIAMRALAWPDAFPHTDYGVLKAMQQTNPRKALEHAGRWQPWRAYAVMHLWHSLEKPKP